MEQCWKYSLLTRTVEPKTPLRLSCCVAPSCQRSSVFLRLISSYPFLCWSRVLLYLILSHLSSLHPWASSVFGNGPLFQKIFFCSCGLILLSRPFLFLWEVSQCDKSKAAHLSAQPGKGVQGTGNVGGDRGCPDDERKPLLRILSAAGPQGAQVASR